MWLALIHEANGVLYFIDSWNPSFREDAIFESSAMVTAVTALDQQILSLAPELNSATLPNLVTVDELERVDVRSTRWSRPGHVALRLLRRLAHGHDHGLVRDRRA